VELLQLLIFLAVSLGILASAFVWSEVARRDHVRAVQRLGKELSKAPTLLEQPAAPLFKEQAELDRIAATLPFDDLAGSPAPAVQSGPPGPRTSGESHSASPTVRRWRAWLRDQLERAGLRLSPGVFLSVSAGAAVALFLVGWLIQGTLLAVPGALAGAAAPWVFLRIRVNARREKLLRQLPPAFDLMARILRSGLSMPQAFQGVAEAVPNPIAAEFARCHDEQNLGVFPEVSFRGMAERTGVLEMKIFVMAMLIQRQTGGNLSEVLERLAALIRDRLRMRGQVRTLTAEGRLQATVLLVLPVAMFFAMRFVNRPYTDVLLDHPEWLSVTGALMAVGALWIRKIIDVE
jgi:tight adherence protein B